MTGAVLLNNIDHADLRVTLARGSEFGDAINSVTVFPTEFEELQRNYAIVFRRDAERGWRSTVLLGLDAGENLYLDGDRWDARYLPALLARGPFSIGLPDGEGEPMIHIDPAHPRVTANGGERVFLEQGGNSPYLDSVARVLQRIHAGNERSPAMFAAFEEHGLIEPVTLEIEVGEGRRYNLPDCHTISGARLAALDGDALAGLNAHDFLRPAIWVQSSLGNIGALIERKMRRDRAAAQ